VDDCLQAEEGGADRLELCSAMVLGGLPPSLRTLIEVLGRTRLPVLVMLRPRAGGFCYSAGDFAAMCRDGELALRHGARGLVFGVLTGSGDVDVSRTRQLADLARAAGREAVFHRAFDVVPDAGSALQSLIELGITRVLTSGRQPAALAGAALIQKLVAVAAGRIEILPGGGIRDSNVREVLEATGVPAVHLAPFATYPDTSGQANLALAAGFGAAQVPPEGTFQVIDAAALRRLRQAAGAGTDLA